MQMRCCTETIMRSRDSIPRELDNIVVEEIEE